MSKVCFEFHTIQLEHFPLKIFRVQSRIEKIVFSVADTGVFFSRSDAYHKLRRLTKMNSIKFSQGKKKIRNRLAKCFYFQLSVL